MPAQQGSRCSARALLLPGIGFQMPGQPWRTEACVRLRRRQEQPQLFVYSSVSGANARVYLQVAVSCVYKQPCKLKSIPAALGHAMGFLARRTRDGALSLAFLPCGGIRGACPQPRGEGAWAERCSLGFARLQTWRGIKMPHGNAEERPGSCLHPFTKKAKPCWDAEKTPSALTLHSPLLSSCLWLLQGTGFPPRAGWQGLWGRFLKHREGQGRTGG